MIYISNSKKVIQHWFGADIEYILRLKKYELNNHKKMRHNATTIRIPPEIKVALQEEAVRRGMSLSEYLIFCGVNNLTPKK